MQRYLEIIAFLCFIWIYRFSNGDGDNSFAEIISDPSDVLYFNKYGHCSVSMGRLHDAYFVEGHLVNAIFKGYELLGFDKHDKISSKDYEELDNDIKKKMDLILQFREKENGTKSPTNHPLNAIHFLRRVVYLFNPILNKIFTSNVLMKRNFYRDLSSLIDRHIREESSCWPTINDLKIAITNFARIIKTYKLPKIDLIKGIIMGHQSIEPLQLDEIIVLVQEANRNDYHLDVLEWTDLLINNSEFSIENNPNQFKNLIRMRATALFQLNRKKESIDYLEEVIKENKGDTKLLQRDLKFYKMKLDETLSIEEHSDSHKTDLNDALCRNINHSIAKTNLRCFYRRNRRGWDRTKVELLNMNPPIYKYYGIVKDEDVLEVLNLVKITKMKQHLYQYKGEQTTDDKHSKEETMFWDEDQNIMKHLSKRISYITGLETNNHKYNTKLSSSGPFKIINYGIGGFQESQVDYLKKDESEKTKDISVFGGDRLATWIYHLTDKVEGGRLAFPKLNISISLEQGTGILWYNLLRNGTINPLSENMECPTAFGSKWILKKYIHENGNMFNRKCLKKGTSFFF